MRSSLTPIRVLCAARLLTGAAFSSVMPFVLLHFTETFKLAAASSGSILGVQELVPVFTGLAAGWLVVKTGTRRLFILSLAALALATLEWMAGYGGVAGLWTSAVVSGMAFSAVRVCFASSVPDLLPKKEASHGFAMLHAYANVGYAVGPLLNAFWVERRDYAHAFMVPIGLYSLATLLVAFGLPAGAGRDTAEKEAGAGLKSLALEHGERGLLLLAAVMTVVFFNGIRLQADIVGLGKYFVEYFHSTRSTSLYWTIESGAVVLLVPFGGRLVRDWELPSLFAAYVAGTALIAAGFWTLGYFGPTHLTMAFTALISLCVLGECLCVPAFGALVVNLMGPKRAAMAFGLASTVAGVGMSVGASLGGFLLERMLGLHSLPAYWQWLGIICMPAFAIAFIVGAFALQSYAPKAAAQEA